jgi:hypothetical protein
MAAANSAHNMPEKDPNIRPCHAHPQVETRLTCTHCEIPICPKCLVVCEVGMKCKKCTSKTFSHVVKVELRDWILGGLASLGVGLLFGFIISQVVYSVGYFAILLCFIAGKWVGEMVHRCARFKMSKPLQHLMTVCSLVGILIGLSPSLFPEIMFFFSSPVEGAASGYHYGLVMQLICSGAFLVGLQNNFKLFR